MPDLREPPFQSVGLVRSDDPGAGNPLLGKEFQDYVRKFYFPQVVDAALLFKPVYRWEFSDPYTPYAPPHPLSVFGRNRALPRSGCWALSYCHWEYHRGGNGHCYAVEPVSLSEGQCAELGMRWSSILTETARRGCDNGYFEAIALINWSDNRTLVRLSSASTGIWQPWVTLVYTDRLAALLETAERLPGRPL